MSVWEFLAAVVVGVAVGVPIGYVQFRVKEWRESREVERHGRD